MPEHSPRLLRVLDGTDAATSTYGYLQRLAHRALDRRDREVEELLTSGTRVQLRARARRQRSFFRKQLGRFPSRAGLGARVVSGRRHAGYRLEKVVLEGRPGQTITALLYTPTRGRGPHPAVLVPCGHNDEGKAAAEYQHLCVLLASWGLAAFCYDPISQGERYQLLDERGKRRYWPTREHTLMGMGAVLLGTNTARHRVWDGMRAIDYLQSRGDIDAERLGCTGYSGGGTLTSYLLALDGRIRCAAPGCYLTSLRRLVDTIGPQDAEQNIHAQAAAGMDHADYLFMGAPTPVLVAATTGDFFDIGGTWDTFRQAKRYYARLGIPERISLVETRGGHGYPRPMREAVVAWMRRWLLGVDEPVREAGMTPRPETELCCTPRGQVMLQEGELPIFDLHAEVARRLRRRRRQRWISSTPAAQRDLVRAITGAPRWSGVTLPLVERRGQVRRKGYTVDKLLLQTDRGSSVPALFLRPARATAPLVLYVHGLGKAAESGARGDLPRLARLGHPVLAPDLGEMGELRTDPVKSAFLAYLLGQSLLGERVAEVMACARFLLNPGVFNSDSGVFNSGSRRAEGQRQRSVLHVVGIGEGGPPVLHAAALEPRLFARVTVRGSLGSWEQLVADEDTPLERLAECVHDALSTYDLPDLAQLIPGPRLTVAEPVDASGRSQAQPPYSASTT